MRFFYLKQGNIVSPCIDLNASCCIDIPIGDKKIIFKMTHGYLMTDPNKWIDDRYKFHQIIVSNRTEVVFNHR